MRLVTWYDDDGFKRQAYVRDNDPDEAGPKSGIKHEPPDMRALDYDEIARDLNNLLVERGIITWADVQKNDNALLNAVKTVMKRRIIALYRQTE